MIEEKALKSFIIKVQDDFSRDEGHVIFNRLMCCCLFAARDALPQVAQSALTEARAYWMEGSGRKNELWSAHVACWDYLEAKGRSSDILDKEDAAIRATLCVLYADFQSEDHSDETVSWFASMFDRLEVDGVDAEQFMVF